MADTFTSRPQTGVCQSDAAPAGKGCCGGPAPTGVDACCVKDADAKARGEVGCGCGPKAADPPPAPAAVAGACCGA